MGLGADAELVWGIPVVAFDEDSDWDYENNRYGPTPFWDVERDDWRTFDGDLYVRQYGHYKDPDNKRGILTSKQLQSYSGDCWEPLSLGKYEVDAFIEAVVDAGFEALLEKRGWWLVASYG